MKLSEENTVTITIANNTNLFRLGVVYDHKNERWDNEIWLETFPNTTESEWIDKPDWVESLYSNIIANMDYRHRTVGYENENEYVQFWFETFYAKVDDMFLLCNEFINAWEDLNKLIGNAK